MAKELTHLTADGSISMVDVSHKDVVSRVATARGHIKLEAETILKNLRQNILQLLKDYRIEL